MSNPDMHITVGHIVDNPTFMFDGRYEITTTDDDGTVNVLYDSLYDDLDKLSAEILIEPVTYMVVNSGSGKLRIEVR